MAARKASALVPYLLEWRAYHGLTQAQLTEKAGVAISTIRIRKNSAYIGAINLAKPARYFGVTPRDLRERGPYSGPCKQDQDTREHRTVGQGMGGVQYLLPKQA